MLLPVLGLWRDALEPLAPWLYSEPDLYPGVSLWTCIGLLGAFLFSLRVVVQWVASEWKKQVTVPLLFWHLSFWGSVVNLLYSLHLDKLPVILGALFLPFIYGRTLFMLRRDRLAQAALRVEARIEETEPSHAGVSVAHK